jgi:hypothetical protein
MFCGLRLFTPSHEPECVAEAAEAAAMVDGILRRY